MSHLRWYQLTGRIIRASGRARIPTAILRLEALEDRTLPATIFVGPSRAITTIQGGVNAAAAGDTVMVDPATYLEQVTITKNLTVEGNGAGAIIQAPTTLTADTFGLNVLVEVGNAATVNLSNLTIQGPAATPGTLINDGILVVQGATATITGTTVTHIHGDTTTFGDQTGFGIQVGGTGAQAVGQVGNASITDCTVTDYQKVGIIIGRNGSSGTITGCTITGIGPTPLIAQNGIQIGPGTAAGATVSDTTISGNEFTGSGSGADPTASTQSDGILNFIDSSSFTGNTVFGNDEGIFSTNTGSTGTTISGNTVENNRFEGMLLGEGTAAVSNNTITGNNIGVAVIASTGDTTDAVGTLVSNNITNNGNGGETFAGGGIVLLQQTGATTMPVVTAHFNRIVGNSVGLDNSRVTGAATVDATNNWWGSNAGPGGAGSDSVGGPVTFDPWLVLQVTASPTSVVEGGVATVVADLTRNSAGTDTSAQGLLPDGIPVSFGTNADTIAPTMGFTAAGKAAAQFTAGNTPGDATVSATVDNQTSSATITVAAPDVLPSVTQNPSSDTVTAGQPVTFTAAASGNPAPTVQWEVSTDGGATFMAVSGATSDTLTFTTTADQNGDLYEAVFTNSIGSATTTAAMLDVQSSPVFTSGTPTDVATIGQMYSFTFTASGNPTPTFSESGALPSGITFNAATGVLSGTPAGGTNGSFALTVTATNSVGSASQSFTLMVNSPIDELGAYRASDGSWSLDSDGTPGFSNATDQIFFSFSPPNVIGVAGDWTGSGTTKIGDFSDGTWHLDLNGNGVLDPGETFTFGQAGDQPVVGDWTGNGVSNIGVFRAAPDGITGEFILDTNGDHIMDAGDETFTFGLATDRIVIGDWNGQGKDEVGVFRDAKEFDPAAAGDAVFSLDTNGDHQFGPGDEVFIFGLITDGVVIGDWNGAGKSEVGVYRDGSTAPVGNPLHAPGTALFSLDTNGDLIFDSGDQVFLYGLSSDQFVSGHWAKTPPLQPEGMPQAQFAANGQGPGGASALTEAQLEPVLDQAIAAWVADGASATELDSVAVQIGTLDNNLVGLTSGNQITLDSTADGWGWNTDASDADFTSMGANGLQATPDSAAAGKMDLLTVIEHELGHELGLKDVDPAAHPASLMASTLPVGTRRTI